MKDNIGNPGVRNDDKVSENNDDIQTPGVKSEIAGVDAEIAVVAWVLYDALVYISIDKDEYSNETSDKDNYEISNREESHNNKIPSEGSYNANVRPN